MVKDTETAYRASTELNKHIVVKKAYVMIIGGKEYNVYVESVGTFFLFGRVAQNKVAVLVDRPGRGGAVVKIVSPQEEKGAVGPGDELLHSEPCVVPSKTLHIRVSLDRVDIIEDPWRPLLDDDAFLEGNVDPEALCKAIPAFQAYRVVGKGFSGSPEAWGKAEPIKPKTCLKIANLDDESSSVE